MKDKLLAKFDEIFNAYITGDQNYRTINDDPVKRKRTEQQSLADLEKATALFKKIANALPEEQRDRLHAALEQKLIAKIGETSYKNNVLNQIVPQRFPTPESQKYHLFYIPPNSIIKDGSAREILEQAVQYFDDKALEEMIEEIDSYQSEITFNVKVQFFRSRVEELKKRNAQNITDAARLKELNDELDSVAQTVITSTPLYSKSQGEVYDAIYRRQAEDTLDALNEKALSQEEYKHYREYFEVDSTGRYGGCRTVSKEHFGDTKMADAFTADNVKMVIPEKTKASIIKVFNYMKENQILRDNNSTNEADHKIYGFAAIYEANVRIRDAIETENVEEIRNAKEQYKLEVERMRGLFELVKEEFNPGPEMMVGNVNSYREGVVPNEFKNDLVLNALISGFFNLNSALSQTGYTIDMLLENPSNVFMGVIKGYAGRATANSELKGKSIAESIKIMTVTNMTDAYPGYGLGRNMEFLQAITYGTDAFEKNSLSSMLLSSYALYVGNIVYNDNALTKAAYLNTNAVESLTNILLVNDEDRDYNKLRAIDSLAIDGTEIVPAFDAMKYLETHAVDAGALVERIKSTVTELYAQDHFKNGNQTKETAIADTIRAAQFAAYRFLLVHPVPSEGENSKDWNALKDIMTKPERVFKNQIDKKTDEALKAREPKHKTVETEGKAKFDAAREEARAAEEAYAKSIDDIKNELRGLSEDLFGVDDKKMVEIVEKQRELEAKLKELPKLEQARLDKAYTDGKLTKDYYEQRKRDVQSGAHHNKVPFGASEYPGFSSFKERYNSELKNGELSKDDVRNLYDRMIENARYEEKMLYIIAVGAHPKPTLEAKEVAIVPERVSIVVEDAIEKNVGSFSAKIEEPHQDLTAVKEQQAKV